MWEVRIVCEKQADMPLKFIVPLRATVIIWEFHLIPDIFLKIPLGEQSIKFVPWHQLQTIEAWCLLFTSMLMTNIMPSELMYDTFQEGCSSRAPNMGSRVDATMHEACRHAGCGTHM
jgi:hypothetical protein